MTSIGAEEGVSVCSFERISSVTRPVRPKAVVWYRFGKVIFAQRRMSIGCMELRLLFMNLRCCFVRIREGSWSVDEAPEAYPDSFGGDGDLPMVIVLMFAFCLCLDWKEEGENDIFK